MVSGFPVGGAPARDVDLGHALSSLDILTGEGGAAGAEWSPPCEESYLVSPGIARVGEFDPGEVTHDSSASSRAGWEEAGKGAECRPIGVRRPIGVLLPSGTLRGVCRAWP